MPDRTGGWRSALTDGQRYTAVIVAVVVVVTTAIGIPPTLRHRREPRAAAATQTAAPFAIAAPSGAEAPSATSAVPGPVPGADYFGPTAPTDRGVRTTVAAITAPPNATVVTLATIAASNRLFGVAATSDTVFVASDAPGAPAKVVAVPATGGAQRDIPLDGTAGLAQPVGGVALSGADLLVAEPDLGVVVSVDPTTKQQSAFATIPDVPACPFAIAGPGPVPAPLTCEPSAVDHKPAPDGLAVLADDSVLVADTAQATIWRVVGALVVPWLQSSELAAPNAVRGMAAAPDGVVFASAAGTLYHAVQGTGGAVASAEAIYVLRPGDDPTGVARGGDGRLYVALAGPSEVLVIGSDGKESARIRQPGTLDRPAALALAGTRLWITGAGSRVMHADVN